MFLAKAGLVNLGQHRANDGASITLSSGFLSDYPNPASVATGPLNAAVDAYVRSAAPLLPRDIRLNVVSPAPVVDDGQEREGAITAAQAAAAYIEAINGEFTGQVLRPWGGLPRI
jgi:NAD(P)-dependent dehydrogenase (short-subunit alcohol dehydrogenase family)